ncbi:MAG: HIT domain-containing protein [Actinobacteria bacterium]|nr:HIT domain-containing protein [Actinomycetota bacterium]
MERLWAGWRSSYLNAPKPEGCVLCGLLDVPSERDSYVIWRGRLAAVVLNTYPYSSGHLMVLPTRHVGEIEGLASEESAELWQALGRSVRAVKAAYSPDGLNVGANLGKAAGAGVPGHLHLHVVPRWEADTNFMTSVAEARVLPEALGDTYDKVKASWPA